MAESVSGLFDRALLGSAIRSLSQNLIRACNGGIRSCL